MVNNTRNISIVSSFISLWLASVLSNNLETLFGFVLILSFGILHGANDLLLFNKMSKNEKKLKPYLILGIYIGVVLLVFLFFILLPLPSLLLFILGSGYHFGEQHWDHFNFQVSETIQKIFYGIYGLFILALLFMLNPEDVATIIFAISDYQVSTEILNIAFYTVSFSLIISTIYLAFRVENFQKIMVKELLYLLVFSIIFKISSLIWGFAIYFIFWHSLPSLYDQITFIYKDFNKKHLLAYIKKAFPYWIISVIAIVIFYYVFNSMEIFYALFFSFLAAVTFPHSFAINSMFKLMKKNN